MVINDDYFWAWEYLARSKKFENCCSAAAIFICFQYLVIESILSILSILSYIPQLSTLSISNLSSIDLIRTSPPKYSSSTRVRSDIFKKTKRSFLQQSTLASALDKAMWFQLTDEMSYPGYLLTTYLVVFINNSLDFPITASKQGRPPRNSEKGAVRCGWASVASEATTYFRSIYFSGTFCSFLGP